jgi:hypothetical protein
LKDEEKFAEQLPLLGVHVEGERYRRGRPALSRRPDGVDVIKPLYSPLLLCYTNVALTISIVEIAINVLTKPQTTLAYFADELVTE